MSELSPQQTRDRALELIRHPEYLRVLGIAGLVGVPVSLIAFGFLALLHAAEHEVWHTIPQALTGGDQPPWWWPLPLLALAGVGVGAVARRAPGRGGHTPSTVWAARRRPPRSCPGCWSPR
ncbi:hypothetical protein ACFQZ4_42080 [Catellatospora coxensis]